MNAPPNPPANAQPGPNWQAVGNALATLSTEIPQMQNVGLLQIQQQQQQFQQQVVNQLQQMLEQQQQFQQEQQQFQQQMQQFQQQMQQFQQQMLQFQQQSEANDQSLLARLGRLETTVGALPR
jgi:uncharacterized protein HemX